MKSIVSLCIVLFSTGLLIPESADAQIRRWLFGSSDRKETKQEDTAPANSFKTEIEKEESLLVYQIPMNQLSDLQRSLSHDYPEVFLLSLSNLDEPVEEDPTAGFRIQLFSTRDVDLADSLLSEFRVWSDSLFADYEPEAYLEFRQPYYKIHIGDFNNRDQAILVARYLKRWYGDAWVVYDQIIPERVPVDSVQVIPNRIPFIQ
jgi:hypothetical protein